ncbi:hypothetical protein CHRY9390_00187 [Chryseobacterium aquaeductus]|uniref:Uncharacterized protein n=1 Tax=Chryseobacterium aquaeductus TaxID=2675056 RepID=A0A9N8QT39_9FLAO|nr:hypothetical protein [Chryseobacterium aquaeductus]CAA7329548.1 hypothetical protein CHRY9390_00187 [Chryseobacterium potabilaquae]CAD7797548.1 hypothetical protein CHRY9390_00187 [Chryseobacterium aquaeductus]
MKNLFISSLFILGLSVNANAQKRPPAHPQPSKTELANSKSRELQKRYNSEKKMIMNHPVATKKMKQEQLRALNLRYQNEKKLLRVAR